MLDIRAVAARDLLHAERVGLRSSKRSFAMEMIRHRQVE
jgi:hypothetical protein